MKLSEIEQQWKNDCQIDTTDLKRESANIPQLHAKYYSIFNVENLKYKQLVNQMKQLRRDRYLYYTGKGSAEQYKQEPLDVYILKNEVDRYLEADQQIVDLQKRIDLQEQKVQMLKNIISVINNRHWNVRNAIEWQKFINGG